MPPSFHPTLLHLSSPLLFCGEREREREAAMERAAPVRKSHASTAGLLTWAEATPGQQPAAGAEATPPPPGRRPHQPSEAIGKVVFGGQVTEEEAESLNKRKPCSVPKWKEMTGSGIFAAGSEADEEESGNALATPNRTISRNYQSISTISHISFAEEESVSPKKPTSLAEVAKQRELSGTLQSEADSKMKRQVSDTKCKELSGHDIFALPEDPRPSAAQNSDNGSSTSHTPVKNANASSFVFGEDADSVLKTAKKIPSQKFTDLTGNDIFKGDSAPGTAEKHHLSTAKLKEMTGSDIFADGKAPSRDFLGGIRKPPGGESSIALV